MQPIERYISAELQAKIDQRYYAQVNAQAGFEQLIADPLLLADPDSQVGLFSDHGVVHRRDVALQTIELLDTVHGVLIPSRSPERLLWMRGYGVLLACFHDIGMRDFSPFGRKMHPEFACQAVFDPEAEDIVQGLYQEDRAGVIHRLKHLAGQGHLKQPVQTVFRELLSLSIGHSKSKMPVTILNSPTTLRSTLIEVISINLQTLHRRQMGGRPDSNSAEESLAMGGINSHPFRFYRDLTGEAYSWLTSNHPAVKDLIVDAIDSVRVLRAADAMRQRGTVLKTSGNYEVFIDQRSGNAIYGLRRGDRQLFLLELKGSLFAGEANIASSEITPAGDLRISFHRGSFSDARATRYAAECAALVVDDIQRDVIDGFVRPVGADSAIDSKSMRIVLEETDDNPDFVAQVQKKVRLIRPEVDGRLVIAPSLHNASALERDRYLAAGTPSWDLTSARRALQRIGLSGHPLKDIDAEIAFAHVRLTFLAEGEKLIEANGPSAFVYIPLSAGLEITPMGGYRSFQVQPWIPLGITGVIRGDKRNATVIARQPLTLLMIPGNVYLRHWHRTHSPESLLEYLRSEREGPT
jgi:hypothetical protein